MGIQPNEPSEQQVVVELLNQNAIGVDGVDRLQQKDQQLLIGLDRGPTTLRVKPTEVGVQPIQALVSQTPHLPQRMIGRDATFCRDL